MNKTLGALRSGFIIAICAVGAQTVPAQDQPKKHLEKTYEMTFSTTPPARPRCHASLELGFKQIDTLAVVDATLNNPDCAASSGDYTVVARVRDENNETNTLEFPQTWQREDDQTINLHAEYVIGENVDLVSVRPKLVHCLCEPADEDETSPENQ